MSAPRPTDEYEKLFRRILEFLHLGEVATARNMVADALESDQGMPPCIRVTFMQIVVDLDRGRARYVAEKLRNAFQVAEAFRSIIAARKILKCLDEGQNQEAIRMAYEALAEPHLCSEVQVGLRDIVIELLDGKANFIRETLRITLDELDKGAL